MSKKNILFVCTGNTCRSPMAEALARQLVAEMDPGRADLVFKSAGVAVFSQDSIAPQAAKVLNQFQADLSQHRATQVQLEDIQQATLVLTMTEAQRDMLWRLAPEQTDKIQTLAQYAGSQGDIPDPFGRDEAYYRYVADHLVNLIQQALRRLTKAT